MTIRIRDIALASVIAAALAAPAYAQTGDEGTGGLEEIIVTAQKREQSVQDVPIAVTAVTQDALQANRITSVNDLSALAPGLTVRPSSGGVQVPTFSMRGIVSYGVVAGSDKQVSIYLDGVYISSPRGSIFDLPDVARLEVLRGPQGTLFGRNATGGAVSVVTRDPTGEAQVKAEFSIGNLDLRRYRISAELPQIGPFSAYFSFLRNERRGEIRNAAAGTVWDRSLSPGFGVSRSPDYLGGTDSNSYFAAVKFEPTDTFKLVYKFDRNEDDSNPDGVAIVGYDPTFSNLGAAAPLFAPIFNALYGSNNIYLNANGPQRPDVVSNGWSVPRRQRVFGHSVTGTWQVSDSITLKNIFAYRKAYLSAPSAIDGISSLTFTAPALVPYATFLAMSSIGRAPGINNVADAIAFIPTMVAANAGRVGQRYMFTASQATSLARQWSDEVQANYSTDRLNLTIGGMWFRSRDVSGGPLGTQNTFSFGAPFLPASGLIPLGNEGRSYNQATSLSAYGQLEYKVTPQIEMVLGARITGDKKSAQFSYNILNNGVLSPSTLLTPPDYKNTRFDYLVGVNWSPSDDIMAYAKYSTSYVSGGTTIGIPYKPEIAKSFEIGLKADWFDRRLRTNLALFHVNYKDHQTPGSPTGVESRIAVRSSLAAIYPAAVVDQLVAPSAGGVVSTYVQSPGDLRAQGFELEVTAAPVTGLTMGGSLAYTDYKMTRFDANVLASGGGEYVLLNRPSWTANLYGTYETQPLIGDATMQFRVDAAYRSKGLLTNTPVGTVARMGAFNAAYINVPAHWKMNARAALRNINLGGIKAEVAVWAKNLTNTKYHNAALFLSQGTALNYDPARTYGLDFGIQF